MRPISGICCAIVVTVCLALAPAVRAQQSDSSSTTADKQHVTTQHVVEMIEIIQKLIAAGHAYAADGHVLFSVPSFEAYGRLSGRSPDELLAGARIDVAPYKRDAGDFVLWKPSPPDLPLVPGLK